MHDASVKCDRCGAPAPLENFNGNNNFRMPSGWVTIAAHITIHGELRDKFEKKYEFKDRLKEMLPRTHLCPDCTADPERAAKQAAHDKIIADKARAKAEEEDRRLKSLTEPARRLARLDEGGQDAKQN